MVLGVCAGAGAAFDTPHSLAEFLEHGVAAMVWTALLALGLGFALSRYGLRWKSASLSRREAVLTVVLVWLAAGVVGALPFWWGAGMHPVDALFESISGLTTTGATVIAAIPATLSKTLLLWRSLLQWLGGMGIVVLFVAVFPNVGAGGKHMFRGEVPGTTAEGLKPRIAETSFALWKLYTFFTAAQTGLLMLLGMSPFEALCHALTTLSTGGFSTRDASIGAFASPAIEMVTALFMWLASINFGLYYVALKSRSVRVIWRSLEFRVFSAMTLMGTVVLAWIIWPTHHHDLLASLRYAVFMVSTTLSSTGYGTDDYSVYPPAGRAVLVLMMFVGGCAGSTAGGIKVERVVLLAKQAWAEIKRSFRPAVVYWVRQGKSVVDDRILTQVSAFFTIYVLCLTAGTLFLVLHDHVPVATGFGAMLTSLSNMGPALFHLGADNFVRYSHEAKLVCTLAMLLGRLEFLTVLALLAPDFWRR